jgi:nicotinamide-nucleotide amidase
VPTDPEHGIGIAFLARSDEVLVKVGATGSDPTAARERASKVFEECLRLLGAAVTSIDDRRVEDEVVDLLIELDRTVATAEGATAGRVAALLTTPADPEDHFLGGRLLAEQASRLDRESLLADAVDVHAGTDADYVVVTAGVVDPRIETTDRPVGTVGWLITGPGGRVEFEQRSIPARDRELLRARTAAFAVEALRRVLLEDRDGED